MRIINNNEIMMGIVNNNGNDWESHENNQQ